MATARGWGHLDQEDVMGTTRGYHGDNTKIWQYQPWPRSQTFVAALLEARNMSGVDVKWKHQRLGK